MRLRSHLRLITLAVIALAACNDSTGPGGGPAILLGGAASASDTIGTILPQALVIEVHDSSGGPAPAGTVVHLQSVINTSFDPGVAVQLPGGSFTTSATAATDQDGQVSVIVALGGIPGTAHVEVTVPSLGLLEYATFTIAPGHAARTVVSPRDTLLAVGGSLAFQGKVVDRNGNALPDQVTWSGPASGLSVSSAGVVTASAIGRYYVKATGPAGADSVAVSVMPPGQFAAWADGIRGPATIMTFNSDGSNRAFLATVPRFSRSSQHPVWIPGTNSIVYTNVISDHEYLYVVGTNGVTAPFFATMPPTMTDAAEPALSADGKWLYFSAFDSRCSTPGPNYCVARARIDGSSPELLIPTFSRTPSPSPDGSKVAYTNGSEIKIFDVATRTTSTWGIPGTWPAWSPDGSQIAYLSRTGELSFVAPDGTGARSVPSAGPFQMITGWSSDGRWVFAAQSLANAKSVLIEAATGLVLPSYSGIVSSMR